jgi:NitT/TauT family transport system substrate-binding protein
MNTPTVQRRVTLVILGIAVVAAAVWVFIGQRAADTLVPVRLALSYKVDYLPQILALDKGLFKQRGIAMTPRVVTGGIEAAEAVTTGSADLGVMGEVPALTATTAPNPAVIVAAYATDEYRHRIIIAPGSKIRTPKDLEGKRFAVQHGSSTYGAFMMYCDKHKLDRSKITMVRLSPRDMPEAMAGKQIDAMAGSEPWPSNVLKRNTDAKAFAVLSGLGCNFPLVVVASRQFAQRNPEAVTRALAAMQDAIEYQQAHPEDAAAILAQHTGLTPAQELASIRNTSWGVMLDTDTIAGLKTIAGVLKDEGVLRSEPSWAQAVDDRYLPTLPQEAQ